MSALDAQAPAGGGVRLSKSGGVLLSKGQGVSLAKKGGGALSKVVFGLGWDVAEGSFFERLLGMRKEHDLDAVAFLLDKDGKLAKPGTRSGSSWSLSGSDIVFFNQLKHESGAIWLTGDNRTGDGDGDDEQIVALLDKMPARVGQIALIVQIYQGQAKGQSFKDLKGAFVRAVDADGNELARHELSGQSGMGSCRSILFAKLIREGSGWRFEAVGEASSRDCFSEWIDDFVR